MDDNELNKLCNVQIKKSKIKQLFCKHKNTQWFIENKKGE